MHGQCLTTMAPCDVSIIFDCHVPKPDLFMGYPPCRFGGKVQGCISSLVRPLLF